MWLINKRRFSCRYCGKTFDNLFVLMRHMKFCESKGKERWFDFVLNTPIKHMDEDKDDVKFNE